MRIAVAATTPDENGEICRHGARAEFYLVYDETVTLREVLQNPFKAYDRGVGIRVADYLAEKAVNVVAAAHLGTGFITALEKKGVRYAACEGSIVAAARDLAARFGSA